MVAQMHKTHNVLVRSIAGDDVFGCASTYLAGTATIMVHGETVDWDSMEMSIT